MTRQRWICLLGFLLLAGARPCEAESLVAPNIVVMLIDDLGLMDSSVPFLTDAEGQPVRYPLNDYYRTPNLERLAAQGVRFNHFYAMSVCSPTRISLMTGQNAARHRTTNWIHPDQDNAGPQGPAEWNWNGLSREHVTLPGLLRAAGYRTIHVGKGHFGNRHVEGADPLNLGFDVNVAGGANGAPASYYGRQNFAGQGDRNVNDVPGMEPYHGKSIFLTEALTREAKRYTKRAAQDHTPFFLYFAHYAVHAPFQSDPRFAMNYSESGKPKAAQAFATLVEGVDRSVGAMLDHFESIGVAEQTLIFFLGDNGSDAPLGQPHEVACAAPLRGKKGSHYEGGVRVPLIAAWAKPNPDNPAQRKLPIPAGAIQSQMAAVYDLFPTILELTGIHAPDNHVVDGRSLHALCQGQSDPQHPRTFLMHYPHSPHRTDYFTTYYEDDWKLIYHYFPTEVSAGSHYQLYHLATDPFEQQDLAKKHPQRVREMVVKMVEMLDSQAALYPVNKSDGSQARPVIPVSQ